MNVNVFLVGPTLCRPSLSLGILCPRGFVIPEDVTADFPSVRVTDPLLTPCGSPDPQGRVLLSFPLSLNNVPAFSKKALEELFKMVT